MQCFLSNPSSRGSRIIDKMAIMTTESMAYFKTISFLENVDAKCRVFLSTSSRWISSILAGEVVSDFSFARTKVIEAEIKELSYVVDCFSWLRRRPGRADSSFSRWERYTEEISKGMRSAIVVNKLSTRLSFNIVLIGFLPIFPWNTIKQWITINFENSRTNHSILISLCASCHITVFNSNLPSANLCKFSALSVLEVENATSTVDSGR